MSIEKINLSQKLALFTEHWDPRIAGELNGQHIKLAKFKGEFPWHKHENEDEMFLVIKGKFIMDLRDKSIELCEGECIIIPKGTEHRPRATEEVHILLFEPAGTLNTGDKKNDYTKQELKWV